MCLATFAQEDTQGPAGEAIMVIVFIGPPGSGKGTQAKRLLSYLNIPHLSTGELLRGAKNQNTPLGRLAAQYMDIGRLVPDPIVLNLVGEKLDEPAFARGCMFDGFPRTVQQAKSLDETLASHGKCLNVVIALHADESELIGRMLRRAAAERRVDDNPETIAQRMEVYHRQTAPVLDYYEKTGLLERIDANGPPDEVFEQIRRVVDRHRGPQGA